VYLNFKLYDLYPTINLTISSFFPIKFLIKNLHLNAHQIILCFWEINFSIALNHFHDIVIAKKKRCHQSYFFSKSQYKHQNSYIYEHAPYRYKNFENTEATPKMLSGCHSCKKQITECQVFKYIIFVLANDITQTKGCLYSEIPRYTEMERTNEKIYMLSNALYMKMVSLIRWENISDVYANMIIEIV
jgi:hypothetical protein